MNWGAHLLSNPELALYLRDRNPESLLDRINGLLNHQHANWPLLAKGIQGLSQVKLKELLIGRHTLLAQHNPQRIISTTAQVDQESIERRPCFLCAENLPEEEKGITFREDFIVLCNPYPIVERHLSIVHRQHISQTIIGHFETLLELAEELSSDYFVLYNGPQCGASAPDHLHFQAGARAVLPIENHLKISQSQSVTDHRLSHSQGGIVRVPDYHIPVLLLCGSNKQVLNGCFNEMIGLLARLTNQEAEPMLNLMVFADRVEGHQPGGRTFWTVMIFPRSKHRPACFFAAGEQKLTVSPAALDLAGLVIVPIREHFDKITSADLRQILAEVTLSQDVFSQLVTGLTISSLLMDITQN